MYSNQARQRRNNYNTDANPYTHSNRGRKQRNLRQELLLIIGLVGSLAAWFLTPISEWVVAVVLLTVPVEADIQLGMQALKDIRKEYRQVSDHWGVERVGWELVKTLPTSSDHQAWDFGVVHADFVNAFALPGGIIRVTDKLLKTLSPNEGELAALLGHEMGHVLHRHAQARMMEQRLVTTLLKALFYEDHDDYDESFGEAVGELLLKSATWLGQQKFSRRDEYQADAKSWELLVASRNHDPRALQSLLAKLWSLEGGSGKTSWESTHPGTKDRIKALERKWNELPETEKRRLAR